MNFDFDTHDERYNEYEELYSSILEKALKHLGVTADIVLSVSLVDNSFIHTMNKDYRNVDRPTDVISFAFLDNDVNREKKLKSKEQIVLGDIYISTEKAEEQAKEYGHPIRRELSFLFVHGLLHLLGYDHMKEEDEKIMFPLQEEILSL